jgi:hypothetical protein
MHGYLTLHLVLLPSAMGCWVCSPPCLEEVFLDLPLFFILPLGCFDEVVWTIFTSEILVVFEDGLVIGATEEGLLEMVIYPSYLPSIPTMEEDAEQTILLTWGSGLE